MHTRSYRGHTDVIIEELTMHRYAGNGCFDIIINF